APADRLDARGHGDEVRSRARPPLQVRAADRRGRGRDEALRDGEALLHRRRDGGHDRRSADPRRLRLHLRVPGRADDARREDHADLRGHEPDPAAGDRARDAEGEPRVPPGGCWLTEQARSFHRAAAEYDRGRPSWPPAVLDRLPLADESTVLDLGAGTGKLTRVLADRYARVIAVEPLDELRAILAERVPEADVRGGVAEAIPAGDAEVDGVFAAQSFHWFANDLAMREIARVLRPGGVPALL